VAGLSIKNKIANGFLPESDKEFKHFLNISKGSCGEVKSMYYTAEDQKYVQSETATERRNKVSILISKLTNFIFHLKK
jgi:four helix bundle protein